MSSKRSYRDPIPQQKVREEIVKGTGTQFDPIYARLMLHLIDVDTEYEMRERAETMDLAGRDELTVDEYRSEVSEGILITPFMTTIDLTMTALDKVPGRAHPTSMILFDSLDGRVHDTEKEIKDLNYFEYGEIWLDGHTGIRGERTSQTNVADKGSPDITKDNQYRI